MDRSRSARLLVSSTGFVRLVLGFTPLCLWFVTLDKKKREDGLHVRIKCLNKVVVVFFFNPSEGGRAPTQAQGEQADLTQKDPRAGTFCSD